MKGKSKQAWTMQEIAHELARLATATTQLSDDLSRLTQTAEHLAEKLGCPLPEREPAAAKKPLRRRNLKDALEAVLETRERIIEIKKLIATMEQFQDQSAKPTP